MITPAGLEDQMLNIYIYTYIYIVLTLPLKLSRVVFLTHPLFGFLGQGDPLELYDYTQLLEHIAKKQLHITVRFVNCPL